MDSANHVVRTDHAGSWIKREQYFKYINTIQGQTTDNLVYIPGRALNGYNLQSNDKENLHANAVEHSEVELYSGKIKEQAQYKERLQNFIMSVIVTLN